MTSVMIAMILRPFAALVLFGLICLPIRLAVQKWLPEGRLKRILLFRIKKGGGSDEGKRTLRYWCK